MRKKLLGAVGTLLTMALVSGMSFTSVTADSGYTNTNYMYYDKTNTEGYSLTDWRVKYMDVTNDGYHGYAYIYNSYGDSSKVRMRAKKDTSSEAVACSNWVIAKYYTHNNIVNTFLKSKYNLARLKVTTPDGTGSTAGVWSPDSSQKYSTILN